jgi:hypothetical protein
MKQHLIGEPLDRTQPVAAGATGRVTIAQAGRNVGHARSAIQRHDLDPGRSFRIGPSQDLAATTVTKQVLRQFGHHYGDPPCAGFIVAKPSDQAADAPAGMGNVGRVSDGSRFHGAISNARW